MQNLEVGRDKSKEGQRSVTSCGTATVSPPPDLAKAVKALTKVKVPSPMLHTNVCNEGDKGHFQEQEDTPKLNSDLGSNVSSQKMSPPVHVSDPAITSSSGPFPVTLQALFDSTKQKDYSSEKNNSPDNRLTTILKSDLGMSLQTSQQQPKPLFPRGPSASKYKFNCDAHVYRFCLPFSWYTCHAFSGLAVAFTYMWLFIYMWRS